MTVCAVCVEGFVVNIIVADSSDPCPAENGVLVPLDGLDCDIGWVYTGTGFINPNPSELSDL
jgi:hypothetical protein